MQHMDTLVQILAQIKNFLFYACRLHSVVPPSGGQSGAHAHSDTYAGPPN